MPIDDRIYPVMPDPCRFPDAMAHKTSRMIFLPRDHVTCCGHSLVYYYTLEKALNYENLSHPTFDFSATMTGLISLSRRSRISRSIYRSQSVCFFVQSILVMLRARPEPGFVSKMSASPSPLFQCLNYFTKPAVYKLISNLCLCIYDGAKAALYDHEQIIKLEVYVYLQKAKKLKMRARIIEERNKMMHEYQTRDRDRKKKRTAIDDR